MRGSLEVGDLVRVIRAPGQPQWIRDLAGQVGILVEIDSPSNTYGRNVVVVGGSPQPGFHHLDLERVQ